MAKHLRSPFLTLFLPDVKVLLVISQELGRKAEKAYAILLARSLLGIQDSERLFAISRFGEIPTKT